MVATIERNFIPIPDTELITPTDELFIQTQEIPVITREETFPFTRYYACFNLTHVEITAGGLTVEQALDRIRWQMVYRYKTASVALESPNPPGHARHEVDIISQFIRCINNNETTDLSFNSQILSPVGYPISGLPQRR